MMLERHKDFEQVRGEESVLLSEQTRREKREIEITHSGWMDEWIGFGVGERERRL